MKKHKYYLWVDTETSGLLYDCYGNPLPGNLLEISAILTDDNLKPIFKKNWILKWHKYMYDTMQSDYLKIHTDNGLINACQHSKLHIVDVNEDLTYLLKKYTKTNSTIMLAGNNISFDKEVIRRNLTDVFELLYYRVLDVSSIKELLLMTDPEVVYNAQNHKQYTHRAMLDIEESLKELQEYWITFSDVINSYKS